VELETELRRYQLNNIPRDFFLTLKQKGYSDAQISWLLGNVSEDDVYARRKKLGINRVYKMVDTCAAEFPAHTPYYYSTFEDENESVVSDKKKIIVLGSGPNRIGQGIEFDYSCVYGLIAAKEAGYESIMRTCSPEAVANEFNMADKLDFEPVFWERDREIIEVEKPEGVIVQVGGQTALQMAERLEGLGIKISGTSFSDMDLAED